MVTLLEARVLPDADQLSQARGKIDNYVDSIAANPDHRDGAFPYYLFHEPGEPIRGTILLFHGFSARPHQMSRLASYLFLNGFNVYQASLVGHPFRIPDKYWPQVDLKPEIAGPLREKIDRDPVLQKFLSGLAAADGKAPSRPSPLQMLGLIARLQRIEPRTLDIILAIERERDPDFDRYFLSSHMNYLHDAQQRLSELDAMPGPIYTVGLSVGGAVALALAAARPDRIQKVVAYAPLLEVYGEERERYVNIAGPLDIREMGWDDLQFPLGCFTATNRFGAFVRSRGNTRVLKQVPTLFVLTENEDAADIKTNEKFSRSLGREGQGHYLYRYPTSDLVPHPMVDPEEVSQGMSNQFWQGLYQETFRFLTETQFNSANMDTLEQDPNLPQVPPV
ncbi:MAG: alpha/beta hydrolase [Leptolyngbyaceae cyanobacterium MO_188.B28]|nr:alpha/beta hydrolase [Leptolyngbyaceae cyanobacterium MO_188.B28]